MRAYTVISLFCLLAAASCQSHDLFLGQLSYGDLLVYKINEYKYGFPFIVRTSDIEFPEPGQRSIAYISAVYIKDHYTDGNGGYPIVKSGGVGQKFLKLKLKSQRGHGFNFTVSIYGRY